MKKRLFLIYLLLLSLLFSGCKNVSTPSSDNPSENVQFSTYTQSLFDEYVSSDILTLHSYIKDSKAIGIDHAQTSLSGYNLEKLDQSASLSDKLSRLLSFDINTLSSSQQITYNQLKLFLETELKYSDLYLFNTSLSTTTGIQVQLPIMLSEYAFTNKQDIADYLKVLNSTDDFFSNICAFEELRSANGFFMEEYCANEIIRQCNEFLSQADSGFLITTFENRLANINGLSVEEHNNLISLNLAAIKDHLIPGYTQLLNTINKLKDTGRYSGGLSNYPNGKDYFSYLLERNLGWSKSVDDYDSLLDSYISSNLAQMALCLKKDATLQERFSTFTFPVLKPDDALNDLKTQMTDVFPTPIDLPWTIKYIDKALEKFASPAMYFTPQIDNPYDNSIYINEASTDSDSLYPTLAHEGYPGHMYELTYFAAQNPENIRYLIEPGGAVEGWATYAELWSYSCAKGDNLLNKCAALNYLTVMCLYAKADIGVNYYGWKFDDLLKYMSSYGYTDNTAITNMYYSLVSDPGNYCKYTLGCLAFLTIKNKVQQELGNSFSELEFHKSILDLGPIQFDILESYLLSHN